MANPDTVRFCPTCNKPFTAGNGPATSYTRHVSYCRRAQLRPRIRRRPCHACRASKAKCSYQARCERCVARGVACVYDGVPKQQAVSTVESNTSSDFSSNFSSNSSNSSDSLADLMDIGNPSLLEDNGTLVSLDPTYATFDSVDALTYNISNDHVAFNSVSGVLGASSSDGVNFALPSWNVPFDFSLNQPTMAVANNKDGAMYLTRIGKSNVLVQRSADLIVDALYAVPEQMRRRETFPPFIHPHWHMSSLPEPLAVCMHISQMYALQNKELRPFIWRSILAEQRRAVQRLDALTDRELLAEMQVGMVYLIMRLVDGILSDLDWTTEMMNIQRKLCMRFYENNGRQFFVSEQDHPSATWEDWIYAESRRRTSMVWFLITSTIVVSTLTCATTEAPEVLPLPAPKTQWEARSQEAWLREIGAGSPALSTFGALIRANEKSNERSHAQMLGAWNATTDSLGSLLNVAVAIV